MRPFLLKNQWDSLEDKAYNIYGKKKTQRVNMI